MGDSKSKANKKEKKKAWVSAGSQETLAKGNQPLDGLMSKLGIENHDLVRASGEQLTHKVVGKGRKGRCLTLRSQAKILRALNAVQAEKVYELGEIFNYRGK